MALEYEVIKQALDPETHDKIRNQVGEKLSPVLAKYAAEIRENKKVTDVKQLVSDIKGSIADILAEHVEIKGGKKAIGALTDSITDAVFRDVFGFDAAHAEKQLEGLTISNYDDFAQGYIGTTRDAAVQHVRNYGATGVQQHMQGPRTRKAFFEKSGGDLGAGFSWSDKAKNESDDYIHVATLLSSGIGGEMSTDAAKKSKGHVQYHK